MSNDIETLKKKIKNTLLIEERFLIGEIKQRTLEDIGEIQLKFEKRIYKLDKITDELQLKALLAERLELFPELDTENYVTPRAAIAKVLKQKRNAQEPFTIKELIEIDSTLSYQTVRAALNVLLRSHNIYTVHSGRGQGQQTVYAFYEKHAHKPLDKTLKTK